mgnify:CR=1 FL=1
MLLNDILKINSNYYIPSDSTIIAAYQLQLDAQKTRNGIFIRKSGHENFLVYGESQKITIYELNSSAREYKLIEEYCDINELRRCINEHFGGGEGGLTPDTLLNILEGSESISVDLNEDGDKVQVKIDEDLMDFILPKEVPVASIDHEVGESNTIIVVKPGIFDDDNGYHVYLEVEGSGSHYGADFTVFPYNTATCITPFHMLIDNDVKECFASLNENGQLSIDLPMVMTPESQTTNIHHKRII